MNQSLDVKQLNEKVVQESESIRRILVEMRKVIIGQEHLSESLLIGLLANGHILLEGVPGLAKTLAIKTLAQTISADFHRVQFTPDLLPADLLGTVIYSQKNEEFQIKKGPIFANFILADEINRSPAKVQSALLEAMQEKQVTIGDTTYQLTEPFLVLATQNPIEQEGTYPLPEAQVDRFMLKVLIDFPKKEDEQLIIRQNISSHRATVNTILSPQQILAARKTVLSIYLDENIEKYIVDLVFATRQPKDYKLDHFKNLINYGASPRASINLALASKARAFLQGRGFVTPEDVRSICYDVMRHRIGLTFEAEAEGITTEHLIKEILSKVEVP
jgi:MoxR-like ATPase